MASSIGSAKAGAMWQQNQMSWSDFVPVGDVDKLVKEKVKAKLMIVIEILLCVTVV